MSALLLLIGAVALVGCQQATPAQERGGSVSDCANPEMTTWDLTWKPVSGAVNYNVRLDVRKGGEWKWAAHGSTEDGETTWKSNYCAGYYSRVRYRVQAIFADDSVSTWSDWTELRRS